MEGPSIPDLSQECDAEEFEKLHVHDTYEIISEHFSASRYKEWPRVAKFIQQLEPFAYILDAGCGNGKYFECAQYSMLDEAAPAAAHPSARKRSRNPDGTTSYEKEWKLQAIPTRRFVVGLDRCMPLLRMALTSSSTSTSTTELPSTRPPPGADLLGGEVHSSIFRPGVFDAAICIAVLHHYATHTRRREVVQRLLRAVSPNGGRILIYVWAFEQPRKAKCALDTESGDALVSWQMNCKFDAEKRVYKRYYHLFRENELQQLCTEALEAEKITGVILEAYYDKENWCTVLQRTS